MLAVAAALLGAAALAVGQVPATADWEVPTNAWVRLPGALVGPYQPGRTPVAGSIQFSGGTLQYHNGAGWVSLTATGVGYWSEHAGGIQYAGPIYAPVMNTSNEAYSASWNSQTNVPTKDAVYDAIEAVESGLSYQIPAPSTWVDDYDYSDSITTASTAPLSVTVTNTADVVVDKMYLAEWLAVDPNNDLFEGYITIYGDDFSFDPTTGPSGTVLYTFTESDFTGMVAGTNVVYDFSPDWTQTNGQVWTYYHVLEGGDVSPWASSIGTTLITRPSGFAASSTYTFGTLTRWVSGSATTPHGVQEPGFMFSVAVPGAAAELVDTLLPSDTLEITVSSGELTLEQQAIPNYWTADASAAILDSPYVDALARTTGGHGTSYDFLFQASSSWEMLGFDYYLDSTARGHDDIRYGLRTSNGEHVYATSVVDDSNGSGGGWISCMFPGPVDIVSGNVYAMFIEDISGDNIGSYVWRNNSAPHSNAYYQWLGGKGGKTGVLVTDDNFSNRIYTGGAAGVNEYAILEQGAGISLTATGSVVTISAGAADYVQLNTDYTGEPGVGALHFDTDNGLLEFEMPGGNVTQQIGAEDLTRVRNDTASDITNGAVVYVTGGHVPTGDPTVALANAANDSVTEVLGMATEDIPAGTNGYVTVKGSVRGLDTSAFGPAQHAYLSDTVDGGITNTPPSFPNKIFHVGDVGNISATVGTVYVNKFYTPYRHRAVTWGIDNLGGNDVDIWGTYEEDALTAQSITSAAPVNLTSSETVNRHIVLEVTAGADTDGTATFTGTAVNETTGAIGAAVEDLTISGTGFYQTTNKFIGTLAITTSDLDLTTDIHTTTYLDAHNQDFYIEGIRFSWTPTVSTWDIAAQIVKVNNDGSYTNLTDQLVYDSGDTYLRADTGIKGHAKQILGTYVNGSGHEGIFVRITGATAGPTGISETDFLVNIITREE
jgi:hypothetical protein